MRPVLARVSALTVTFGSGATAVHALRDADLAIPEGGKCALIGESGSGKTTFALALAGLLPPEARMTGAIDFSGLGRSPVAGRDTGFVFQDPGASLNPVLPVGELVGEGARRHLGLSRRAARQHARTLLGRVLIPDPDSALDAYPHQFSGGQKQRIAIAAAIACEPRLLIADEPTSALDTIVQAEIVALLDGLVRETSMTLVFITHDIALAAGLADRIAVLKDGRVVEEGPARALINRPRHAGTRALIADHLDLSSPPLVGDLA